MTIGERIQELRRQHLLSQEEMAQQLSVSKQSVSKWELDKAVPNVDKIISMCKLFGITTDSLLLAQEDMKEPAADMSPIPPERRDAMTSPQSGIRERQQLTKIYALLLCASLLAACAALICFGKIAVSYSGFVTAREQQTVCVERIYRQNTIADVMYMTADGAFATQKVYLDEKGVREGDWIFADVSGKDHLSFPYETNRLMAPVITAIFFFALALLCSILIYQIQKAAKTQ